MDAGLDKCDAYKAANMINTVIKAYKDNDFDKDKKKVDKDN